MAPRGCATAAVASAVRKKREEQEAEEQARDVGASSDSPNAKPGPLDKGGPVEPDGGSILPGQAAVRHVYQLGVTQALVAVLIMTNFLCTIIEKEIDPYSPDLQFHSPTWFLIDQVFTWCFVIELAVNMYGSWFAAFWRSGWNWFDFIIVFISVLSSAGALTGPLKLLKTLRAFRVFRLFKRIEALNKIISALFRAIPGAKALPQSLAEPFLPLPHSPRAHARGQR